MRVKLITLFLGLFLVAAPAAQAHTPPSLASVFAHTQAAEIARARAVAEFEAHALGAGRAHFTKNRGEMGLAVAEAAQTIQNAQTPAQRLAAAKAVVLVAMQAGRNETSFARVGRILPFDSALQLNVIRAARHDADRTKTALAQLALVMARVPVQAKPGIATAIAAVAMQHGPAVAELGADVTSAAVGMAAKTAAANAIKSDVEGQALAVKLLKALKPQLPLAAQTGVDTALAAIAASLDAQAAFLTLVEARAPADVKATIVAAIATARAAAANARS